MGRVVPVVAPDAAQARGARGARRAQPAHQLDIQRLAVVARVLGRIDHELLPWPRAARAGLGRLRRLGEQLAVALADLDALERRDRVAEHRPERGQRRRDALALPDRDHHQRDVGVAA